jgi:hypothetical protein
MVALDARMGLVNQSSDFAALNVPRKALKPLGSETMDNQ